MALKRVAVLLVLVLTAMVVSAQDLTETFTTADGSLTFNYPAGFQAQEIAPGTAGVIDSSKSFAVFVFNGLVFDGLNLTGVIDPFVLFASLGLIGEEVGEQEPITLANGSGTLAGVVLEEIGNGFVAVIETDAGPLIGLLAAESGEVTPENRELGLAIIGSAVITESTAVVPDIPTPGDDNDDDIVLDECAIAPEAMPEGVVQFCGGVELSLPEGWVLSAGYQTIETFAGIQTEDFSVSASIGVNDVSEYYNPDIYFTDVVTFTADTVGHEEYDPAEHVVTLVDEDTLTIQLYDPTQYIEIEEDSVVQVIGVVTLNRDLFVTVTFTWVPSFVDEDVAPVIDEIIRSVRLNDTYTGSPAYIVVDGEPTFVYEAGWTDSTYLFAFSDKESYIVNCPAEGADLTSIVWGTDIYTDNSSVCVAAVHAGAITTDGGAIRVVMLDGQESYTGSERNGVTTEDYGSWGGSFSVEAFTTPE